MTSETSRLPSQRAPRVPYRRRLQRLHKQFLSLLQCRNLPRRSSRVLCRGLRPLLGTTLLSLRVSAHLRELARTKCHGKRCSSFYTPQQPRLAPKRVIADVCILAAHCQAVRRFWRTVACLPFPRREPGQGVRRLSGDSPYDDSKNAGWQRLLAVLLISAQFLFHASVGGCWGTIRSWGRQRVHAPMAWGFGAQQHSKSC
mmetsp:Transcript_9874/g.27554  ORF Transcript_9874/g.27554 Transcript_9874/m.27554 type:complete len:200 (+) Transcript_9874:1825-2424(+)